MEIYTEDDQKYYEKIAPYGHRELHAEYQKWKKKYSAKHYKWTFGTDKDLSADDLYFLCIEIHRDFLKRESPVNTENSKQPAESRKSKKAPKKAAAPAKSKPTTKKKPAKSATSKKKKGE